VSLDGVLRSELVDLLNEELGQFIRDPRVQARALIRILIVGGVRNPASYSLPPDVPLDDAITAAGGFTATSSFKDAKIQRGSEDIWEGNELVDAQQGGETLDQMHLQAGDQLVVFVPDPQGDGFWRIGRYIIPMATAVVTAVLIQNNRGG
jgi:protein involved in polysaccharide export with SLBB domain